MFTQVFCLFSAADGFFTVMDNLSKDTGDTKGQKGDQVGSNRRSNVDVFHHKRNTRQSSLL